MKFDCEALWKGNQLTLNLHGEMTWEYLKAMSQPLGIALDPRAQEIIVDMSGVEYLDEEGMAALLGLIRKARTRSVRLRITGENKGVAARLARTGIYTLMTSRMAAA